MNTRYSIGNGILWAAAIMAAALCQAPTGLTSVVLPALAAGSLFLQGEHIGDCHTTR